MKNRSVALPSALLNSIPGNPEPSRLANFGRLLLATMCVSLVSFATAPKALATVPNGVYNFTSASGTVKFAGGTIDFPQSLVKQIAKVTKGEITIRNRTLQLNKNATAKIVTNLGDDFGLDVETSVTGPNSVVLTKTGTTYSGGTAGPIVTTFKGSTPGQEVSGELNTDVTAKVTGKTLKVTITFSGEAFGSDLSGKLILIAKR